jgi:hypothetical protein
LSSSVTLAPRPLAFQVAIFSLPFTLNHFSFSCQARYQDHPSHLIEAYKYVKFSVGGLPTPRTTPKPGGTDNTVTQRLIIRILEPEKHCRGIDCYAKSCYTCFHSNKDAHNIRGIVGGGIFKFVCLKVT